MWCLTECLHCGLNNVQCIINKHTYFYYLSLSDSKVYLQTVFIYQNI